MKSEPQKEHQWLQKLVGEWTSEAEMKTKPGEPPIKTKGTERCSIARRSLDSGRRSRARCPARGSNHDELTLGYDPQKGEYVGTWVGSMMTHMWIYNGALDGTGNVLTLDTEGPSMAGDGKMSKYQDVIEFKSDDHRILASQVLGDDGKWNRFMTAHYRRRKRLEHPPRMLQAK